MYGRTWLPQAATVNVKSANVHVLPWELRMWLQAELTSVRSQLRASETETQKLRREVHVPKARLQQELDSSLSDSCRTNFTQPSGTLTI